MQLLDRVLNMVGVSVMDHTGPEINAELAMLAASVPGLLASLRQVGLRQSASFERRSVEKLCNICNI